MSPRKRLALAWFIGSVASLSATPSAADPPLKTAEQQRATTLTLAQALAVFRARSFDLRAAQALVAAAEGEVMVAGQIENPVLLSSYTRVWNYRADGRAPVLGPCITCAEGGPNLGLNDSAALIHTLTGERAVKVRVAKAALRASRLQREDARRLLEFQLKSQYIQVLAAQEALGFTKEIAAFANRMGDIGRARFPGMINEGQLARLDVDRLRADLAVTAAEAALDGEFAGLAFLLDNRDARASYVLDAEAFRFRVPPRLATLQLEALVAEALAQRPDLRASGALVEQAQGNVSLAKYQMIPDVQVYMLYVEQGTAQNTATPPMMTLGIQTPLPVFNQAQGEVHRAQSNLANQLAVRDRAQAQVIQDVRSAVAAFTGARRTAEVMVSALLQRSKQARDIADAQFQAGAISLVELLDSERQYTAVTQEYVQDLVNYWNAVFALEQAVGVDLRR